MLFDMLHMLQTVSIMLTFFLAMILNPPVLKTAQEEIDRVIGPDRLPTLADRASLPYIDAILKETIRWQNVLPTGVEIYVVLLLLGLDFL